jgi:hypothetical protein
LSLKWNLNKHHGTTSNKFSFSIVLLLFRKRPRENKMAKHQAKQGIMFRQITEGL